MPQGNVLWVIAPAHNEEEALPHVVSEWMSVLRTLSADFTFCVIDDGSNDRSTAVLNQLNLEYPELRIERVANTGHGGACLHGYHLALRERAQWVLQIDSDGQCDPHYFPDVWKQRETSPLF